MAARAGKHIFCEKPLAMTAAEAQEMSAAIRAAENGGRRVPIIGLTAHAMKGDRERCLDAGMDDYVSKPLQPQELFDALERLLRVDAAREP